MVSVKSMVKWLRTEVLSYLAEMVLTPMRGFEDRHKYPLCLYAVPVFNICFPSTLYSDYLL